jgi:sugar lactone lactonase YvrE
MTRLAILLLAAVPLPAQLNVDTVAGGKLRTGVPAQDVALSQITGMAWDPSGNLVFCDRAANLIRRVRPDGVLETLAGTGTTGFSGDGGPALNATFNTPGYPRFDPQGNLYFADAYNYRIRRIDIHGIITSVVGDGIPYRGGMDRDGPALERSIGFVTDLVADSHGNVYFVDDTRVVRRTTSDGRLETFAAPATGANLLAIDAANNVYVAEGAYSNSAGITRYSPDGTATAFAGFGPFNSTPTDDDGQPANGLYIYRISSLAAAGGNVYLAQEPLPVAPSATASATSIPAASSTLSPPAPPPTPLPPTASPPTRAATSPSPIPRTVPMPVASACSPRNPPSRPSPAAHPNPPLTAPLLATPGSSPPPPSPSTAPAISSSPKAAPASSAKSAATAASPPSPGPAFAPRPTPSNPPPAPTSRRPPPSPSIA